MILLGGIPTGIAFGNVGWFHADIPTGGDQPSPLADDLTPPADLNIEFIWWLTSPLPGSGLTLTSDQGAYNLLGASPGTYVQGYGVLFMPPTGAPSIEYSTITTTIGATGSPPVIALQPQAVTVMDGLQVTLSVIASAVPFPVFQWRRNGVAIPGAVDDELTFVATGADDGAEFTVDVSNAFGTVSSNAAEVTVMPFELTVMVQPETQTAVPPNAATFQYLFNGAVSVQAQRRDSPCDVWVNVAGAGLTLYTSEATTLLDECVQFRFVATGPNGEQLATNIVGLRISPARAALSDVVVWEAMLPRVLPFCASCAPPLAEFHLREAAIDFYQRTLSWIEALPAAFDEGPPVRYAIAPPAMTTVASVLTQQFDTSGRVQDPDHRPCSAGCGDPVLEVALRPDATATGLPGVLYEHHADHIVAGALARLLNLPNETFFAAKQASEFMGKFELAIARVSRMPKVRGAAS